MALLKIFRAPLPQAFFPLPAYSLPSAAVLAQGGTGWAIAKNGGNFANFAILQQVAGINAFGPPLAGYPAGTNTSFPLPVRVGRRLCVMGYRVPS